MEDCTTFFAALVHIAGDRNDTLIASVLHLKDTGHHCHANLSSGMSCCLQQLSRSQQSRERQGRLRGMQSGRRPSSGAQRSSRPSQSHLPGTITTTRVDRWRARKLGTLTRTPAKPRTLMRTLLRRPGYGLPVSLSLLHCK